MSYTNRGITLEEHFLKMFVKGDPDECWNWNAAYFSNGYGAFRHNNKMHKAHRVSYSIFNGYIPENMYVCHTCDNPSCVNPNHLFLGTPAENMLDKVKKNRQSKGESHSKSIAESPKYRKAIQRGEKHHQSKLTNNDRVKILELLESGMNCREVADRYPVTASAISAFKRRYDKGEYHGLF